MSLNKAMEDRDMAGAMNFTKATTFLNQLTFLEEETLRWVHCSHQPRYSARWSVLWFSCIMLLHGTSHNHAAQ